MGGPPSEDAVSAVGSHGRERRRSAEVRSALLASAARLFARHGFARTSTREIAADARVAETAVYRHFGSKQELFVEAVIKPLEGFADHYATKWLPRIERPTTNEEMLRAFIDDFYDALRTNRDAVVAFLMAQGDPEVREAFEQGCAQLEALFGSLTDLARALSARSEGLAPVFTEELTSRFIVGMVVLATAFDRWFLPSGDRALTKAQIVDVMAAMVIPGLAPGPARPGHGPAQR